MLETSPIILFFNSPKINEPIILFMLRNIPVLFCIPQEQNRPQNSEIETFPLLA